MVTAIVELATETRSSVNLVPQDVPVLDPVILRKFGGDGTAEVDALIGDKILDLFVYRRLLKRFKSTDEGTLTMLRSTMVSNERLAAIGKPLVVPRCMSLDNWENTSIHEKGTAVECIIGRTYLNSDADLNPIPQFSPALVRLVYFILDAVESNMQRTRGTSHILEPLNAATSKSTVCAGEKNPMQALFEWLQNEHHLVHPAKTISVKAVRSNSAGLVGGDMFVATFELLTTQPPLIIKSPPQLTKKHAKLYVVKHALKRFSVDSSLHLTLKQEELSSAAVAAIEYPDEQENDEVQKQGHQAPSSAVASADISAPKFPLAIPKVEVPCDVPTSKPNEGVVASADVCASEVLSSISKVEVPCDVSARKLEKEDIVSNGVSMVDSATLDNNNLEEDSPTLLSRKRPASFSSLSEIKNPLSKLYEHLQSKFRTPHPASAVTLRPKTVEGVAGFIATFSLPDHNPPIVIEGSHVPSKKAAKSDVAMAALKALNVVSNPKRQRTLSPRSRLMRDVKTPLKAEFPEAIPTPQEASASEEPRPRLLKEAPATEATVSNKLSMPTILEQLNKVAEKVVQDQATEHLANTSDLPLARNVIDIACFEEHTPWDSSPLPVWFERNWSKKPMNALILLKARIGATYEVKFWRYRIRVASMTENEDVLIIASFWDRGFDPVWALGSGINSGFALKSALIDLWMKARDYVNLLIDSAHAKELERNTRIDACRKSAKNSTVASN